MKSNVANTTNRPDGLMTRLKDGVSKPLRTVILSGAALLAPDVAENVLPNSGGDPYALHAADEPQETESNSKEAKPVELARVDNATKKNEANKADLDIYETPAWKEFKDVAQKTSPHLIDIMQEEIAEVKKANFTDTQIAELIKYGMDKTIPENVTFGISIMSGTLKGKPVMNISDIQKFYDQAANIARFDLYDTEKNGRATVLKFATSYAYNKRDGLVNTRFADAILKSKHRENDEEYRNVIMSALFNKYNDKSLQDAKLIYQVK